MKSKESIVIFGAGFVSNTFYELLSDEYEISVYSQTGQTNTVKINYSDSINDDCKKVIADSKFVLITIGSGDMDWVENNQQEARKQHIENLQKILENIHAIAKKIYYLSSDNVFIGNSVMSKTVKSFTVNAAPQSNSLYGFLKIEAERMVLQYQNTTVIRVPLLVSFTRSKRNLLYKAYTELLDKNIKEIHADSKQVRFPTFIEDLIDFLLNSACELPLIHFSSSVPVSRFEIYSSIKTCLGLNTFVFDDGIYPSQKGQYKTYAPRSQVQLISNVNYSFSDLTNLNCNRLQTLGGQIV